MSNRFEVTGRLVRDIAYVVDKSGEPYVTKLGGRIAKGSIADPHSKRKGDVSYFDFVIYGKLADEAVKSFKKGEMVNLVGWQKQVKWTNREGQGRTRIDFNVTEVNPVFLQSKTTAPTGEEKPSWATDGEDWLDGMEG
jgi:single-stranded DNA-binding protein